MQEQASTYEEIHETAGLSEEELTVVLVRGGSREEVLRLLGADPASAPEASPERDDGDSSGYAATEVAGGVVALEPTGYADPSIEVLAGLSALGGRAAVVRTNIQGHERFGCARDGVLVFDADEYMYVEEEDKQAVPPELADLFDSVWDDLEAEESDNEESAFFVGWAMAAQHTGVSVTSEDLTRAIAQGYHRVSALTYTG